MAGHSKWANIKHRKGRQDAKRSKVWSKCSRAIIVAAKNGGSGDPAMNLALRYAIEEAKAQNMPKDTIAKAIEKGTGGGDGVSYEEILYEGYGPNGVAIMLDILTDNRNRTAAEIRKLFEKGGGNQGTSGSVAFNFERKGEVYIEKANASEEKLMNLTLEAGAEDIEDDGDAWHILCDPSDFIAVKEAIENADIEIASSGVSQIAINTVECTGKDVEKVMRMIEAFEDNDDVQKVHANFDISDEEMAKLNAE
ncbi:MAG: YebC/PmpR family DNA-binding transcriptional regulator [Phycisphaerales bacterium JB063]